MRILLVLLCLIVVGTSPALAERAWSVTGNYGDIVALDCEDCGDNIGMSIACQGVGSDALVRIPFAAMPDTTDLRELIIDVDGQVFTVPAAFEEQGLIGYVPVFYLPPNDPLIDAIAAGSLLGVRLPGYTAVVGLRNSRQSLDIFRAHCGWNELARLTAPEMPVAFDAPVPAPQWFIREVPNDDGKQATNLIFGVPETDGVVLSTTCVQDDSPAAVDVFVSLDTGVLQDGDGTEITISARNSQFTYPAKVVLGEETMVVQFTVGARAPLWRALQAPGELRFGLAGGAASVLSASDSDGLVTSFVDACFPRLTSPPKKKPGIADTPYSKSESASADPRPVDEDDKGDKQETKVPDALEGKSRAEVEADDDESDAAGDSVEDRVNEAPATSEAKPAGSTKYGCADGHSATLAITGEGKGATAELQMDADPSLSLKALPAGTLKMFAGKGVTVLVTDNSIQVVRQDGKQLCNLE